jgi:hypothetical protein
MIGAGMTVPKDVLRFEILLYLSLLLDALSAAFFGIGADDAAGTTQSFVSFLTAVFIAALVFLVWLAARRQKNWARWTLFGFFVLTIILYADALGEMTFSVRTLVDLLSLAASALGFYFSFSFEARQWFRS